MQLVTPEQMREIDRTTIEEIGIPGIVLMERAALGAVEHLLDSLDVPTRRFGLVCGGGNNGGDGLAMARMLADRGFETVTFLLKEPPEGDAATNLAIHRKLELPLVDLTDAAGAAAVEALGEHDVEVWVDAIFGTGLDRPVEGRYADIVSWLERQPRVFGVDIPSGLDATTGQVLGCATTCFATATFGLPKLGQAVEPARSRGGDLRVVDIGVPDRVLDEVGTSATWLTSDLFSLSPRPSAMHKGDSGRIVVLGGATGTTGAAIMCASAALRSGAGLVTIACPSSATQAVHASLPQAMAYDWTLPLGDIFGAADVIVCGPGMGTSAVAREALEEALDTAAIVVLDADALNLVAADPDAWSLAERDAPTVLTPHPGEAARLLGDSASDLLDDSYSSARRLATTFGACSVFKSSCATVAAADGRLAVNASGNPGMATGGMGDALAGIVAARLCDEPDPFEALCEAVFAHGMAGDIAAERVGERALSVADLIDALPTVWLLWEER